MIASRTIAPPRPAAAGETRFRDNMLPTPTDGAPHVERA